MINTQPIAEIIIDKSNFNGKIAVILGSGLSRISDKIVKKTTIPYSSIPNYPITNIEGHQGEFVIGELNGASIIVAKGRMHYYEGYSFDSVTAPIRVLSKLGIKYLIITNSAGSLKIENPPGNFMIADSHMDFTFRENAKDPLINSSSIFHDHELIAIAKKNKVELMTFQSNAEHELVDRIQAGKEEKVSCILFNPGAFTHTSVALRDAILGVDIPLIEIHISNIFNREAFREKSYFSDIAVGIISGFGEQGYKAALELAIERF